MNLYAIILIIGCVGINPNVSNSYLHSHARFQALA